MQASSWTALFTLDWYAFFKFHGSGYLSPVVHTILVLVSPAFAAVIICIAYKILARPGPHGDTPKTPEFVQTLILVAFEALYIPVALAFFRAVTCGTPSTFASTFLEPIAPVAECGTSDYTSVLAIAIVFGLLFLVVVPLRGLMLTSDKVVYHDSFNHERYLTIREVEYLLDLNDIYERNNLFNITSFTRPYAFFRIWQCLQRLGICAALVLLGPSLSASVRNRSWGAAVMFILVLIPLVLRLWIPTYRLAHTNRMQLCADVSIMVTGIIALISSGVKDINNPQSAAPTKIAPTLAVFNILALVILIGMWSLTMRTRRNSANASNNINGSGSSSGADIAADTVPWVTSEADILDICVGNSELLTVFNTGKLLLKEALFTPSEFFPRYKIRELVNVLKRYHSEFHTKIARARGGEELPLVRFTPKELAMDPAKARELLEKRQDKGLALEWSVEDTLEDLMHLYSVMRHTLSALDDADGVESSKFQLMHNCLRGFGSSLKRKNYDRTLMRPEKHMLIRKLLVLRFMLGSDFLASNAPGRKLQGDIAAISSLASPLKGGQRGSLVARRPASSEAAGRLNSMSSPFASPGAVNVALSPNTNTNIMYPNSSPGVGVGVGGAASTSTSIRVGDDDENTTLSPTLGGGAGGNSLLLPRTNARDVQVQVVSTVPRRTSASAASPYTSSSSSPFDANNIGSASASASSASPSYPSYGTGSGPGSIGNAELTAGGNFNFSIAATKPSSISSSGSAGRSFEGRPPSADAGGDSDDGFDAESTGDDDDDEDEDSGETTRLR